MAGEKKKNNSGQGPRKRTASRGSGSKGTSAKKKSAGNSKSRPKGKRPASAKNRSGGQGEGKRRTRAKGTATNSPKSGNKRRSPAGSSSSSSSSASSKRGAKNRTRSNNQNANTGNPSGGSGHSKKRTGSANRSSRNRSSNNRNRNQNGNRSRNRRPNHRNDNRRRDRHSERSEMGQAFDEELMAYYYAFSKDQLEDIMVNGETPDVGSMEGYIYRGMNIGKLAKLGGVQKFAKGFYWSKYYEEDGIFNFGYNIPVVQNGIENEWELKMTGREPKRFGYYQVYAVNPASRDNKYPNALLLNYKCRLNPWYDPTKGLRDYVVRINSGSDDLLLGKAYYAVGARVLAGFFVLHRFQPTDYSGPYTH